MNEIIPSIKVAFSLIADYFDLDQVTNKIGVTPDSVRTRDSWPSKYYVKTVWSMERKKDNCIAVSDVFEKLINVLKGKEEIIKKFCSDYGIETSFEVVIHMNDGDSPKIVLPREIVSFAASVNAEIGFDIYCYE